MGKNARPELPGRPFLPFEGTRWGGTFFKRRQPRSIFLQKAKLAAFIDWHGSERLPGQQHLC
jgi:hypothetical protein